MRSQLYEIVSKVLEIPVDKIHGDMSREDTASWDSFNHLLLITAIEAEMGIKLTTAQIQAAKTIRDLESLAGR